MIPSNRIMAGGPLKPFFGLSGALRLGRVSLPLFLACMSSIAAQSPPLDGNIQRKIPLGFARGGLSTPQIIALR
ncbi:MAG: hypothetical protein WBE44_15125 [Terriglobales bacterium]